MKNGEPSGLRGVSTVGTESSPASHLTAPMPEIVHLAGMDSGRKVLKQGLFEDVGFDSLIHRYGKCASAYLRWNCVEATPPGDSVLVVDAERASFAHHLAAGAARRVSAQILPLIRDFATTRTLMIRVFVQIAKCLRG